MRLDDAVRDDLAGGVDDRDLHAGAVAGVETHRGARAGRGGQQQVAQVRREDLHGLVLGELAQAAAQVDAQVHEDPGPPRPPHGVGEPLVAGAAAVVDAEAGRDAHLERRRTFLARLLRLQDEVEDLLLLAAEQRQDAVRRELGERLVELEVVRELGSLGLLALADLGDDAAARPHLLAQLADQVAVLAEPFDQDGPRALQSRRGVRDLLARVDELRGFFLRVQPGVAQQRVGQRFETGLLRDLGLRAALLLVGEVEVLEPRLGVGGEDLRLEGVVELALLADRVEDGRPALFQFAQVAEPLLERAQLRVVETAGRLLAVPGDERDGRATVEQLDSRADLAAGHAELVSDLLVDERCHSAPFCPLSDST